MRRSLGTVVVAASVWAAALALPAASHAKEGAVSAPVAASSPATAAQADVSAQKVKRARKPSMRRVAAVAPPAPYHSQCFLFFCGSGGRPFNWLVLGVAY
jgi:hypothetical protein